MEQLHQLEKTVADWYKGVPHLPKEFTRWLADNIWWLVIIGVILSVLALIALVPLTLFAFGLTAGIAATYGPVAGYTSGGLFGVLWLGVLVSLVSLLVTTILELMAISPLKNKAKTGWTLLFAVAVLNFAFNVVSNIVSVNVFGLIMSVIWAAIWGYFLFEIRGYFGARHKADAKTTPKA